MTDARVAKRALKVLVKTPTDARVAKRATKALIKTPADARVAKRATKALIDPNPTAQVSRVHADVLEQPTATTQLSRTHADVATQVQATTQLSRVHVDVLVDQPPGLSWDVDDPLPMTRFGPTDQYGSAIFNDNPAAYWRFDDTASSNVNSATWSDASGNGRILTNSSTEPLIQQAGFLTTPGSNPNFAVNGAAGGTRNAQSAAASWNQLSAFSVDMIMQAGSAGGNYVGQYTGTASTSSWLFWRGPGFAFIFSVYSGSTRYDCTCTTSVFTSTTYHVGFSLNGTAMAFFLNGAAAGTATAGGAMNAPTAPISCGYTSALGGSNFAIDELAYYPSVLASSRFTAHNALK